MAEATLGNQKLLVRTEESNGRHYQPPFNLGQWRRRVQKLVRMRRKVHAEKCPPFRVSKRLAADMGRRISSHRKQPSLEPKQGSE